nr:hypothetical protein [Tanacetum cinerariifolium]
VLWTRRTAAAKCVPWAPPVTIGRTRNQLP